MFVYQHEAELICIEANTNPTIRRGIRGRSLNSPENMLLSALIIGSNPAKRTYFAETSA
jgi:hypothetical protein